MPVTRDSDVAVSSLAAVIGEPARARILVTLLDGRMRTGAELAIIAGISPSTTSVHLSRLESAHLIEAQRQGRHCFYGLSGPHVVRVLKDLGAFAAKPVDDVLAPCAEDLRGGRRCYDHMAGDLGILLHDACVSSAWVTVRRRGRDSAYEVALKGVAGFAALGIDVEAMRELRRRVVYGCPDWHEGAFHLGGALGAALAQVAQARGWVAPLGDSRGLRFTETGRRELLQAITRQ